MSQTVQFMGYEKIKPSTDIVLLDADLWYNNGWETVTICFSFIDLNHETAKTKSKSANLLVKIKSEDNINL